MSNRRRPTLADAAQQMLSVLGGVMGEGAVFIASYQGQRLVVEHVLSVQPGLITEGSSLSLEQAPYWRLKPQGSPMVMGTGSQAAADALRSLSPTIHSCLVVPVTFPDGHGWGVLCAASSTACEFRTDLVRACEALGLVLGYTLSLHRTSLTEGLGQSYQLSHDMDRALSGGGFHLVYQPIVCLGTGRVKSMEALIRWDHPTRGAISPSDFIPLAEETGLIMPIGEWVLREACVERQRWATMLPDWNGVQLSVNLSASQVQQPALASVVAGILGETRMSPSDLRLEVTETALYSDLGRAVQTLHQLRALGVSLALDDFGTGYSSLEYLKLFPVDGLKIDRTFTAGLGRDARDDAIVRSVVTMAQSMGIAATAEGVESADQVAQLRQIGCHYGQGFHFARPLSGVQSREFLRRAAVA